ncbi:MAG: AAA family ATPase, partial [Endomicrobium sp.]|nr:AAA family ATPase [Endomicrobium sp.]
MKTLPIGIQSFSKLINENKIYIDKTKYIHELIKNGSIFFLSRPRRFGKSLLVSTFEELFKGNNSLFKGLYIYEKWNWEEKHPVIHLDFAEMNYSNSQELKTELLEFISETAEQYAIELKTTNLASRFAQLIRQLHITTGKQVVILVDEYDKPVTDNLSNKEVLSENKRILHDFYQVIKATDEHLKFVFLTGVSKFSGLSVFSALNSINDITVDNRYSAICGYTQEELEENFKDYIIALSKELGLTHEETIDSVREWYNGYSWDAKILIYNPFSTLMLFDKKRFDNYWFRTGTPTFLLNLIHKHNRPQNFLGAMTASGSSFESYNPDNLNEIPLLFQTGYLTIKNIKSTRDGVEYTLDFPDREVRDSFLQYLLSEYTAYPKESMPELFKELS